MVRNLSLGHSSVSKARRITRPSKIYEKETMRHLLEILLSLAVHTDTCRNGFCYFANENDNSFLKTECGK